MTLMTAQYPLIRSGSARRSPRALLLAGTALAMIAATAGAQAAPTGGSARDGAATITPGTTTVVDQTAPRAVIDWSSYDVAPGETVRYQHGSASDATLNLIHDSAPSVIEGRIESVVRGTGGTGGSVILYNGNGIAFTGTAVVDVGSLIATSVPPDIDAFRTDGHVVLDADLAGTGAPVLQYDPSPTAGWRPWSARRSRTAG
jgi:filamentous hemagglutinin family protein